MSSRNEDILNKILSDDTDFPLPQSAIEGLLIELGEKIERGGASEEQIKTAIYEYLDEHPELIGGDELKYFIDSSCNNIATTSASSTSIRVIGTDGKYMYIGGETQSFLIARLKITSKTPAIDKNLTYDDFGFNLASGSNCLARDMVSDGTYLYFAIRSTSGSADVSNINGGIAIVNQSDFTVAGKIETRDLFTSVCLHGNYLLACRRTGGWCVYDKSSPLALTQVWESCSGWDSWDEESQTVRMAEVNGVPIACVIGFSSPIRFYNMSDPTSPVLLWSKKVSVKSDCINMGHTYHCVVDGTMVYATGAPSTTTSYATYKNAGVIVLDISDVLNGNVIYDLALIPADDVSIEKWGDTQPTFIEKVGNYLLLPDYKKGIRVFKINEDKSCTFVKNLRIIDKTNGKYPITRSVLADRYNRIYLPTFKYIANDTDAIDGTNTQVYAIQIVDAI